MPPTTSRFARQLRCTLMAQGADALTDGELLEAFLARRDEAAFAALVRRHGPMILGVCRRVVGNVHDAEDAYQATFLVLAQRAATIVPATAVGPWLYGVAYRTARRARHILARRRVREKPLQDVAHPVSEPQSLVEPLSPVLDQELKRLPERLRTAVILCDLEGRSRKEAARQLGLAEGTLSSRLATARKLLAQRLTRRGVGLASIALTTCVPPALAARTVEAVAGNLSPSSAALAAGVIRTMDWMNLKIAAAILLTLSVFGATLGLLACRTAADQPGTSTIQAQAPPQEKKQVKQLAKPPADPPDVWTLNFSFRTPRTVTLDIPGQGKKQVWYLYYEVLNPTGEPRLFLPDFELIADDKAARHDEVLPTAVEELEKIEDPLGKLRLKNSVTISSEPIPPTKPKGETPGVPGVALWLDVPADAKQIRVHVHGASNYWTLVGKDMLRRKTLVLRFERRGNELRQAAPPAWEYQRVKIVVPK